MELHIGLHYEVVWFFRQVFIDVLFILFLTQLFQNMAYIFVATRPIYISPISSIYFHFFYRFHVFPFVLQLFPLFHILHLQPLLIFSSMSYLRYSYNCLKILEIPKRSFLICAVWSYLSIESLSTTYVPLMVCNDWKVLLMTLLAKWNSAGCGFVVDLSFRLCAQQWAYYELCFHSIKLKS